MAKTVINVGTTANDGTGDQLRTAFQSTNANFDEIYAGTFPIVRLTAPATSKGAEFDLAGMIAYGTGFMYICTEDWSVGSGANEIWQSFPVVETAQPW